MAAMFLCTDYRRAEGPYDAGGVGAYSSRAPSLPTNLRLSTNAILSGIEQRQAGLQRAAEIGRAAGLRYVYAGNLPGQLGKLEDTYCPGCGAAVVERRGFRVLRNRLTEDGHCPDCNTSIAGQWGRPSPDRTPFSGTLWRLCTYAKSSTYHTVPRWRL